MRDEFLNILTDHPELFVQALTLVTGQLSSIFDHPGEDQKAQAI